MRHFLHLLGLSVLSTAISPINNANHIFNAIHSSMRQWGSSLNHNGVSFFRASVPQGTTLYHGASSSDSLVDIGWMAFDPEHALVFARAKPHRPAHDNDSQKVMKQLSQNQDLKKDRTGWLHTYQTAKELKLVYVDGLSAGKSQIGTLDSQDRILFNDSIPPGGVSQETRRALMVCEIASKEWDNRIDGVIRMAAGFEIILCAPERNLVPVRVTKTKSNSHDDKRPVGKSGDLLRTVTSRYDGIGGDRVVVNYDHFVSAYESDLDLFSLSNSDDNSKRLLPRLVHFPADSLHPIRQQLTAMVLQHDVHRQGVNWQAITDMTVQQYGRRLRDLVSSRFTTIQSLLAEIARIWEPFIDPDHPSIKNEVQRCSNRFIPGGALKISQAYRSIYVVNERICSTLATVLYEDHDHAFAVDRLHELMDYLAWPVWKECRGCRDNEFCAIPIWPQGSVKDYEHPRCQSFDSVYSGRGYWGSIWH